jgi:hypothetical protein
MCGLLLVNLKCLGLERLFVILWLRFLKAICGIIYIYLKFFFICFSLVILLVRYYIVWLLQLFLFCSVYLSPIYNFLLLGLAFLMIITYRLVFFMNFYILKFELFFKSR